MYLWCFSVLFIFTPQSHSNGISVARGFNPHLEISDSGQQLDRFWGRKEEKNERRIGELKGQFCTQRDNQ